MADAGQQMGSIALLLPEPSTASNGKGKPTLRFRFEGPAGLISSPSPARLHAELKACSAASSMNLRNAF